MIDRDNVTEKDLEHDSEIFSHIKFDHVQPSPFDERDYNLASINESTLGSHFPKEYDGISSKILNQGAISSCVAHASATSLNIGEYIFNDIQLNFSPGFIYGNRGDNDYKGEGMYLRQALKQLNKSGCVLYEDFPYNLPYDDVEHLIFKKKNKLLEKAKKYAIKNYYRCYTERDIKDCIIVRGGVLITIPIYTNFGRDLHKPKKKTLIGYHSMIIIGWTEDDKWIVQNSWGKKWGYDGKLLMDFDYPVDEYWGITVQTKEYTKPLQSKLIRFFKFIGFILKKLFKR